MAVPRPGGDWSSPPRDTLTGDPEVMFSFNRYRELLAPGGETAGDGRSVNARRASQQTVGGPRWKSPPFALGPSKRHKQPP